MCDYRDKKIPSRFTLLNIERECEVDTSKYFLQMNCFTICHQVAWPRAVTEHALPPLSHNKGKMGHSIKIMSPTKIMKPHIMYHRLTKQVPPKINGLIYEYITCVFSKRAITVHNMETTTEYRIQNILLIINPLQGKLQWIILTNEYKIINKCHTAAQREWLII